MENKEQSEVPGSETYKEDEVKLAGKNIVSKFNSYIWGIMTKYKRFHIPPIYLSHKRSQGAFRVGVKRLNG